MKNEILWQDFGSFQWNFWKVDIFTSLLEEDEGIDDFFAEQKSTVIFDRAKPWLSWEN